MSGTTQPVGEHVRNAQAAPQTDGTRDAETADGKRDDRANAARRANVAKAREARARKAQDKAMAGHVVVEPPPPPPETTQDEEYHSDGDDDDNERAVQRRGDKRKRDVSPSPGDRRPHKRGKSLDDEGTAGWHVRAYDGVLALVHTLLVSMLVAAAGVCVKVYRDRQAGSVASGDAPLAAVGLTRADFHR